MRGRSGFGAWVAIVVGVLVALASEHARAQPSDESIVRSTLGRELLAQADPSSRLAGTLLLADAADPGAPLGADFLRAEDVFAALRAGSRDPEVLWVAATRCPFAPTVCDAEGAVAQLVAVAPDDGAHQALAALAAIDARDTNALRRALDGMAAARRFDLRAHGVFATLLDALERRPLDPRWTRLAAERLGVEPANVDPELARLVTASELGFATGFPPLGALADWCVSPAARAAGLRANCARAMNALARRAGTVHEARIGHVASVRLSGRAQDRGGHAERHAALAVLSDTARAPNAVPSLALVRDDLRRLRTAVDEIDWLSANALARGGRAQVAAQAVPRPTRRD
jgi:hypothetical protein